ncbi:TNF receptor-associated factor 2-like [Branchiostoma floridae]|uniref:TNF receptor-associated factor 2-like n=1 Tax=Branchiostoma floridae TaxID=7739 RepID=C3ZG31_BRAFL|nr:TNF receptor-associated factor 2-like [Branchiostoma floridae]|eukprot:XP_002592495.1 hypothetical protein BRAFLDRAFT_68986 [Branchiostoma floridae]
MPGFPDNIFKTPDNQKYRCPFCQLILRDPVQTHCGHRYCSSCLDIFNPGDGAARCLSCPKESPPEDTILDRSQMYRDRFAEREIEQMEVTCPMTGCGWEGSLGDLIHKHHCPATDDGPLPPADTQATGVSGQDQGAGGPKFPDENDAFTLAANQQVMSPLRGACASTSRPTDEGQASSPSNDEKNRVVRLQVQMSNLERQGKYLTNVATRVGTRWQAVGERLVACQGAAGRLAAQMEAYEQQRRRETRVGTFEGIVAVLNREIEKCSSQMEAYERQRRQDREIIETLERKVRSLERIIALKDVALAEQDLRIQTLELTSYDGILTWKIADFTRKRHDAITGKTASFYSPCFFTSRTGYKMCARIYLNGDGMGKGTHVSLFFVVMRGHYDGLLRWPFRQKVTFMLLDQNNREHVIDAFRPDPTSSSFQRPTSDMNIASGCPLFVPLSQLDSSSHGYVRDDTLFIRVIVDTSDLDR